MAESTELLQRSIWSVISYSWICYAVSTWAGITHHAHWADAYLVPRKVSIGEADHSPTGGSKGNQLAEGEER